MKRMINVEKFLDKLLYMGYMDEQKSEVEEVANRMTEDAYTKDEVIAMLKELQDELKYTNLSGLWKTNYAEGFNDSVAISVKKIQCRINKLKENECD